MVFCNPGEVNCYTWLKPKIGLPRHMDLKKQAAEIAAEVEQAKLAFGALDFEWYPYATLSNIPRIEKLAAAAGLDVLATALKEGVVDIGCGDGELSYFFEKLGCTVTAIDYSEANNNGMRGVEALLGKLGSRVSIYNLDLDSGVALPRQDYGIAIFFGVLYHVKNPFLLLERIAQSARYCFLSTRIARRLPGGASMENVPVAYLLGETELNGDDSNYWIFSPVALERLFERSHWNVLSTFGAGVSPDSDPVSLERDERVFYLLESRYGLKNVEFGLGWHSVEGSGWRWTERCFAGTLKGEGRVLSMRAFVPEALLQDARGLTLSARVNGQDLGSRPLESATDLELTWPVAPAPAFLVEFELNRAFAPSTEDPRELGIIVASLRIV